MRNMITNFDSDELTKVWVEVQNLLVKEYGEATYKSWLSKLSFKSYFKGILGLSVPTKFLKEWIINNYLDSIKKHWVSFDNSIKQLEIFVLEPTFTEPCNNNQSLQSNNNTINIAKTNVNQNEAKNFYLDQSLTQVLDQRFTFDSFVVGAPNEFAYAAARSVAEATFTNAKTNPLFLYGGVGLGKTHLMHAMAWYIYDHHPERKVMYISAEKFMYQFVRALRNKEIISFKEYFRSVDVLMIDDVQFICGKDSTQEEFFHTFNALSDNNCQIVISCDRSPSDLDGMEERIKSRLGWGLVADIHSTTYELRLGILQSKVEQMKITIPKEVLEFLATKITTNVRELEGALNKVVAHSKLIGLEITLENTAEILRDLLRSSTRLLNIEEIQKKVAEHYNIRMVDLSSSRRMRVIARPRQVAMYLSKMLTSRSYLEIGKKFGGKDHTTVMHAIKNIEKLKQTDSEISDDIRILTKFLQC